MKTLVTGGAGFIGSHIATRLVEGGHSVRVLDNLSSGKRENLAHVARDVELVTGDIRDAARLEERCARGASLCTTRRRWSPCRIPWSTRKRPTT